METLRKPLEGLNQSVKEAEDKIIEILKDIRDLKVSMI